MNKKGFTLVELLAVLVVLALISLIAIPAVTKIINSAKSDVSDSQMKNIERVLDDYIAANADTLADGDEVCIIDLKKEGLLTNKDIINSKTGEEYKGCFYLSWNSQNNQFDYFYGNDSVVVTFNANGGTLDTNSKTVYVGSKYGSLPTPVREGYTFKGWNGKNKLDISKSELSSIRNEQPLRAWGYIAFDTNWIIDNLSPNKDYTLSYDAECISIADYDSNYSSNLGFLIYSKNLSSYNAIFLSKKYMSVGEKTHEVKTTNIPEKVFDYSNDFNVRIYTNRYLKNNNEVLGNIKFTNLQLEEGSTATPYEPYYITKDTTVVQTGNHTLTAIWEAN